VMPDAFLRIRSVVSANLVLLALALATSVALGAIATRSPPAAVASLVILTATLIALTRPVALFALGIVLLAIEPAQIFGVGSIAGRAETYKLILYACTIPLLIGRGVERRKCAPLVGYGVVILLTELFGTPLAGLTTGQTAASLATLSLGWLVFAIKWNWQRDQRLLKVLAWMPILSVLFGALLQIAGILPLFRHTSPPRLEGATIAAWLGTFGVCGVIACIVMQRRGQWKWAVRVGLANVVIVGGTLTRGAVLALAIIVAPSLARFIQRQLSTRGAVGVVKLAIALVVAICGGAVLVSGLRERNEDATVLIAGQGSHEIASGRFRAWQFAYEQAKVNLAFGRGVGAGPIVGKSPGSPVGFTAQHNEYVRMLLEVGIVGSAILLTAMATTLVSLIRRAPWEIRADLAAAGFAFAVYSVTENTLSASPIAFAFLLVFGIAGSKTSTSRLVARQT
jgi:teichuronic acid biosynthesis protein TuaE